MSQLPALRSSMLRKIFATRGVHTTSGRFWWSYQGWFFDDYKARRWPRTEEERKAAAARYGIREGDYKPVKEDYYSGIGDYPDLGEIQYGVKDPYENWSMDKHRRNYGEPVHYDLNINTPDRYTFTNIEQPGPVKSWFKYYIGLFAIIWILLEFPVRFILPLKPKQYPYDYNYAWPASDPKRFPLTNYTFEPANTETKEEHH